MILAAGLGTRLRPLTHVCPKVLIPIMGAPVLDFWIERLYRCGFEAAVLNAYHLKEQLAEALSIKNRPIPVEARAEAVLLGTGGGIRTVLDFFDDKPFAVINGDIICDAPLDALFAEHVRSGAEVSLVLHDCPEFNNVAVGEDGSVLGFGQEAMRIRAASGGVNILAFTGIHFINPDVLRKYPPGVPGDILAVYRDLISRGAPPKALCPAGLFWREMGSVSSYMALTAELGRLVPGCLPPINTGLPVWVHPEAAVSPGAELRGSVAVGRGTRILDGARIENSIVWENVLLDETASLRNCIVADGMKVSGRHTDSALIPAST